MVPTPCRRTTVNDRAISNRPGASVTGRVSKSRHEKVDENADGQRIDNFLIRHCPGVPRSHLYQLIRKGQVLVNGRRVKQTRRLVEGEQVRIPALTLSSSSVGNVPDRLLRAIGESILYQHPDFIILDKPPGIAVHGGSGLAFGLIDGLRQHLGSKELELSHRLDRATSGCLLVGRNLKVNRELQNLFRERQIEKHYFALVHGRWPESVKTIDAPLLKNVQHAGERRVLVDNAGLPATTHFEVVGQAKEASLLKVLLDTGRTHQIRVHTLHAGHSVVGDTRYGDNKRNAHLKKRLGSARLFLHAASLSFNWKGQVIHVKATTDKAWNTALEKLSIRY